MCLEEQSPQGLVDIGPFTVYKMFVGFEKKGMMDLKLTGHGFNRPPAVQRGEESDRIIVAHEAHSVFKPNAVNQKNLRGTNIAGYIGYKVLAASEYLTLVWRFLDMTLSTLFNCLLPHLQLESLGKPFQPLHSRSQDCDTIHVRK